MKVNIPKDERSAYIANVLSIAKSDATVSDDEVAALRVVLSRIGAGDKDLVAARNLLGDGHYRLQMLSSPAISRANAQDMIMIALADGDADGAECEPIERVAAALNYSQADVDLIMRRAESELHQMRQSPRYKSRHAQTSPSPVKPPPVPKKEPERPSVPMYTMTQAAAPGKTPQKETVSKPERQVQREAEPTSAAAGPERTEPDVPPVEGAMPQSAVEECMCQRERAKDAAYCFGAGGSCINVWGCRLAGMDWHEDADWLGLGHFRSDDVFVFDKRAIAARLSGGLSAVLECPYFNAKYTEAAFDALPARARAWGRWVYRRKRSGAGGARRVVVVADVHGCMVSVPADVTAVVPLGIQGALRIIRDAARRCGRTDINMRRVRRVFEGC
jgi:uncharacterized tellurite resistance protein B-like protein